MTRQSVLYGVFTGLRLEVDAASFALGGILIAYLLRPRLALAQTLASATIVWTMFYHVCETFRASDGLLHSACYNPGPDGLAGYRLSLMMFSFGALPILVRATARSEFARGRWRPAFAVFAGIVGSTVISWFPLTAWFSGASYIPLFLPVQALVLFGFPGVACGIGAARISGSLRVTTMAGLAAALFLTGSLWTSNCPGCDRSLLFLAIPSWALFSGLGGFLELGNSSVLRTVPRLHKQLPGLRRIVLAGVVTVGLWSMVAYPFWIPSVLYATPSSPDSGPLYLGLPVYRPYVAGYYNSTQYRICCLEIGVSFVKTDPALIGAGNFLMAGMGVQSPNCCIDGWDFGWRADVFLLPGGEMKVSGTSWETCDSNANCGGHLWQNMRYHAERMITPPYQSTTVFLRMMWEAGRANWYYNYTGVPWQLFGRFTPDFREGPYFDIGVIGPHFGNDPYHDTYFFQFGVGSRSPVAGWTIRLEYPSFQFQGNWRLMEKAAVIQGDLSYWKAAYRWGGAPYLGVTARAKGMDPTLPPYIVDLEYSGGSLRTNTPLW